VEENNIESEKHDDLQEKVEQKEPAKEGIDETQKEKSPEELRIFRRYKSAKETLTSEQKFNTQCRTIMNYHQILEDFENRGLITAMDKALIIPLENVLSVEAKSHTFLEAFQAQMKDYDRETTILSTPLMEYAQQLTVFAEYGKWAMERNKRMSELSKSNDEIKSTFLEVLIETNCDFWALCGTIWQRPTRVLMLVQQIVKHTSQSHPDYDDLQEVVAICSEKCELIDIELGSNECFHANGVAPRLKVFKDKSDPAQKELREYQMLDITKEKNKTANLIIQRWFLNCGISQDYQDYGLVFRDPNNSNSREYVFGDEPLINLNRIRNAYSPRDTRRINTIEVEIKDLTFLQKWYNRAFARISFELATN